MQRAVRTLSIALITAGLVMLVEAGLTLLWTEPISALYTTLKQSQAEDDLDDLRERFASGRSGALSPAEAKRLAGQFAATIDDGDAIGRISIEETGTDLVIVEGTDAGELQVGPGHYPGTVFPGEGKTVGIAGHRTTYGAPFREIDALEGGERIVLEMPYGEFTYSVISQQTVLPSETEVLDDAGRERLVLTACHPLYSAAERIVVSARLIESSRT